MTLYWDQKECPHCKATIDQAFDKMDELAVLFDETKRVGAQAVSIAVTCPKCFGMIRLVLQPSVTVVGLTKLAMTPMLVSDDGRLRAPRQKRSAQAGA